VEGWTDALSHHRSDPEQRCRDVRSAELDGVAVDPHAIPLLGAKDLRNQAAPHDDGQVSRQFMVEICDRSRRVPKNANAVRAAVGRKS
jgi:hypothetical protein